jgi:hypothetical protein
MKRKALLTCIATLVPMFMLTIAFFLLETAQAQSQTQKQKGISYPARWSGEYSYPDANPDLALANLAVTGANWIGLIVSQYQDNISSTVIYSNDDTTLTDTELIHVITQAHNLGLKVMLKPHVDLAHDSTHWRGQIGQGFTDPEWITWFTSYQGFINHYAQLAQSYGVELFCVGTELSASQVKADNWRAVVTGVRSYYSGPLTYAANHGDETYDKMTWWDAVDYIGVDAYYPLTSECDPTVVELKAAWQPHVSALNTLASTWSKSIIFTEIGYRSLDCTNIHPWDWQITGTIDLQEQADAYQAAFESLYTQPWFAGIYWWAWETDPFQGGPCDDGYTPYDKPAENVLRSWYGAPPRASEPTPQPDYNRTSVIYTDSLNSGWEVVPWAADVILTSTNPVYSGTHAISITAQAYGALSLGHSNFDSAPYYWLEFYVRTSTTSQQLRAFVHDENGSELFYRPIDNCRYIDKKPIEPGVWTRVRIPLSHMDASGRRLQRVSIKNFNSQPSSFWVDEIRLVGASWRVYLPMVIRSSQ